MKKYLIFLIICIPWLLLSDFYPYKLEFNMQPPFMNNATFNVFQPSFFEDYDQNTPESQPLLFTISIQNISAEFIDYEILFVMRWRDLHSD
ncbi:MAG: hypothetical protein SVM86_07535, partial [Candidatus Cloacimonadota bacterium]|nr:hypothetical protein [Candidatus Cloacimonadota bacterium]